MNFCFDNAPQMRIVELEKAKALAEKDNEVHGPSPVACDGLILICGSSPHRGPSRVTLAEGLLPPPLGRC